MTKKDLTDELISLFNSDDGALFIPKEKFSFPTPDNRLAESFKQITDFVEEYDRQPDIESLDINEAMLAKRLEAIKNDPKKSETLKQFVVLGLLVGPEIPQSVEDLFENDNFRLFNTVGNSVLNVRKILNKPRPTPEYVSKRVKAKDFEKFKQGFIDQQNGLANKTLKLIRYESIYQLKLNHYYVHDGQMLYVDEIGKKKRVYDRNKERLRVIFENGTESDMYKRSLSARLYEAGYAVVDINYTDERQALDKKDMIKGYIYVLKSKSEDPKINTIKDLYKIGYSTTPIATRIKNAEQDPTYLMAEVELIESFIITGDYNPQKIEHFIHRVFADAALDISIIDKNGRSYIPKEWYCVPIHIIRFAVELIDTGEIVNYIYDSKTQEIIENTK